MIADDRRQKADGGRRPNGGQTFLPSIAVMMAALAMVLVVLPGCRKAVKTAVDERIPVRLQRVEQRSLKRSLDYAGDIRAREAVLVYPKVSGKIIEKVHEEGARVVKGDIIAYIDRDEVGFDYQKAPVESPLAGFIGRVYVDRGSSVTVQTPVAMVVDIEAVELLLNVPEKYIAQIKLGQNAELTVDAWPGGTFTGQVTKVSPVIDLETRTTPIEITAPNTGYQLKPGMFARVRLILEEHANQSVVIKEAVLGRAPDTYVFVVSNNTATVRNVRLGLREGSDYEVVEGLKPGEQVVIMGQQRLHDGIKVRAEEIPRDPNAKIQN
ncbi:MAG: efflux RND transporter periplasmic adaptor subunit [Verrucomicrobia bacterium]|nr:efflux RND transporter periplasmic adaptor subunit [Verrucomicrobiota bacterium]MBU1734534.1 efflux RND transporter periplasmic adaptor subunit [Verrucomicrobiota bacterium]MBU1855914.1 efflux RND transporter periplasmic adaptor subunit [Verrucomicrobiota bacterium]